MPGYEHCELKGLQQGVGEKEACFLPMLINYFGVAGGRVRADGEACLSLLNAESAAAEVNLLKICRFGNYMKSFNGR